MPEVVLSDKSGRPVITISDDGKTASFNQPALTVPSSIDAPKHTFGTLSILSGAGAPALSAPKGTLYINTTGSTGITRLYIATDAVGTWTPVTCGA